MTQDLKPGIYQHYKGKRYQVYGVARHSETEEQLVVYRCLYGNFDLWVRPLAMFAEQIIGTDGNKVSRFEFIHSLTNTESDNEQPL